MAKKEFSMAFLIGAQLPRQMLQLKKTKKS